MTYHQQTFRLATSDLKLFDSPPAAGTSSTWTLPHYSSSLLTRSIHFWPSSSTRCPAGPAYSLKSGPGNIGATHVLRPENKGIAALRLFCLMRARRLGLAYIAYICLAATEQFLAAARLLFDIVILSGLRSKGGNRRLPPSFGALAKSCLARGFLIAGGDLVAGGFLTTRYSSAGGPLCRGIRKPCRQRLSRRLAAVANGRL